jgi:hypothetical protein
MNDSESPRALLSARHSALTISICCCLRNYRNQRVHGILNWRLAMPYLQAAAASELEPLAATALVSSRFSPWKCALVAGNVA